jgi:hypothetical protein
MSNSNALVTNKGEEKQLNADRVPNPFSACHYKQAE